MSSAGSLSIRAALAQGRLSGVEVELQRPPVTRLFIGKSPEMVRQTLPLLYSLCTQAQWLAAGAALAAAAGAAPPEADADRAAPWIELLHENFWRLLLDWPPALGLPPARQAFMNWRAARQGAHALAQTHQLLAQTLDGLAAQCLQQWGLAAQDTVADVPRLAPDAWLDCCRSAGQAPPAPPPPESVAAAYLSRIGLARTATQALAEGRPYPLAWVAAQGWAVAQTLTARGVLTHAVRLFEGRVADYRVWAPTDVFFADASALSSLLADQCHGSAAAARRSLEQAVLALDPCLPYELELDHA